MSDDTDQNLAEIIFDLETLRRVRAELGLLNKLSRVLGDDMTTLLSEAQEKALHEAQPWLRAGARAFFARVDGMCYRMRMLAVELAEREAVDLSDEEVAKLIEKKYDAKRGILDERRYNRFLENVDLAFDYFTRVLASDFRLDKSGEGWPAFREALAVRDRLTHPKDVDDLVVEKGDLRNFYLAEQWFEGERARLSGLASAELSIVMARAEYLERHGKLPKEQVHPSDEES